MNAQGAVGIGVEEGVQDADVEMDVEVEGGPEAMHEAHRPEAA